VENTSQGKLQVLVCSSLTNSETHYKIAGKNAAVITMEASTKLHDSEVKKRF